MFGNRLCKRIKEDIAGVKQAESRPDLRGKSSEHEVSVHTALSVINAVDKARYEVLPIYIDVNGQWVQGPWIEREITHVNELRFTLKDYQAPNVFTLNNTVDVVFPVIHGPNGEDGTLKDFLSSSMYRMSAPVYLVHQLEWTKS